jgi:hypothetical protein
MSLLSVPGMIPSSRLGAVAIRYWVKSWVSMSRLKCFPSSSADPGLGSMLGLLEVGSVGEGVLIAALDLVSPFVDVSSFIP